jgi:hypothetical protein
MHYNKRRFHALNGYTFENRARTNQSTVGDHMMHFWVYAGLCPARSAGGLRTNR